MQEPSRADLLGEGSGERRKGKAVSMGSLGNLLSCEVFSGDGDQEFKFC